MYAYDKKRKERVLSVSGRRQNLALIWPSEDEQVSIHGSTKRHTSPANTVGNLPLDDQLATSGRSWKDGGKTEALPKHTISSQTKGIHCKSLRELGPQKTGTE